MTATACVDHCRAYTINATKYKSECFVSMWTFIEYTITIHMKYRVKWKTRHQMYGNTSGNQFLSDH